MTDVQNHATTPEDNTSDTPPLMLAIESQYIKDLSFEAPQTPVIFHKMREQAPAVSFGADVKARHLDGNVFEVVLHVEVKADVGAETAFMLELAYGAVVQANPVEADHLQPLLLIEAPRMLFPFVRNIIADVTRDGGFPQLMLQPIDFAALYRHRLAEAARPEQENTPEQV